MAETLFALPAGTTFAGVERGLTEQQWSQLAPLVGSDVDWQLTAPVSPSPVTGRLVTSVPALTAQAGGFMVKVPSSFEAQHPVATSTRWDMIGIRLDWTPGADAGGGKVQGVVITGGSTCVLPASRKMTLGQQYDIPIAMSLVDATSSAVRSIVPTYRSETKVATVASLLAIPSPQLGQIAWVGQESFRWDGSRWADATPATKVFNATIRAYDAATIAKAPASARILSEVTIPDPGYPYSILVSAQFELDPVARTRVVPAFASTSSATAWTTLYAQFYTARGTRETKTLRTQVIPARTGQTVVRLLSEVSAPDLAANATYSTTSYNGQLQAVVLPR